MMQRTISAKMAFAIVACVVIQVNQVHSFSFGFQQHAAGHGHHEGGGHPHHGHHGGGGGGWLQQGLQQLNNMGINTGADQVQGGGGGWGKFLGGFGFGNMGQNLMQQVKPHLGKIQKHMGWLQNLGGTVAIVKAHTPATFYDDCGKSVRQCYYAPKPMQTMQQNMAVAEDVPETAVKPEMQHTCVNTKHICVGNRETCVSEKNCDVVMKLTETEVEGKKGSHVHVSYLNNCKMDGQSVTDNAKMPQMYFGIGFATYNEAGSAIECRKPTSSDFKLVFLWKNSTVDERHRGICTPVNSSDFFAVQTLDMSLMNAVTAWPGVCKSMNLAKEGGFNFKTFLKENVPSAQFTPFFKAPFDFADNISPEYSSNKMVITGTVA